MSAPAAHKTTTAPAKIMEKLNITSGSLSRNFGTVVSFFGLVPVPRPAAELPDREVHARDLAFDAVADVAFFTRTRRALDSGRIVPIAERQPVLVQPLKEF
jgi:hypothetical protein